MMALGDNLPVPELWLVAYETGNADNERFKRNAVLNEPPALWIVSAPDTHVLLWAMPIGPTEAAALVGGGVDDFRRTPT